MEEMVRAELRSLGRAEQRAELCTKWGALTMPSSGYSEG
jgi:hypothetical protein